MSETAESDPLVTVYRCENPSGRDIIFRNLRECLYFLADEFTGGPLEIGDDLTISCEQMPESIVANLPDWDG